MKAVITFLFAVVAAASAHASVRLGSDILGPKDTSAVIDGRDAKVSAIAFSVKGGIGAAVWINEVRVIYANPGGPLVTKNLTLNKLVTGASGAIAIPDTGLPVHRLLIQAQVAGTNDDVTLTAYGE